MSAPRVLLLALSAGLAAPLHAGETAAFLKIGVGARPVAMGSAYTAIADDVNAVAWNPAGLALLPKRELGAMHAEMFAGLRYDFLGFAHPTRAGAWGLHANLLTQPALNGRDASGRPTGGFEASDKAFGLAYARRLTGSLRLGGNIRYLESTLAEASARSFSVDLGGLYDLGGGAQPLGRGAQPLGGLTSRRLPLTWGVAVQNLGPGLRFLDETNPLPLTLATGLGYRLPIGLTLALDYKYRPHAKASEVSVGTEYAVLSAVALRMGYASSTAPLGLKGSGGGIGAVSGLSGLGAGLGLKLRNYSVDYAFTPFGALGDVQRISVGGRF